MKTEEGTQNDSLLDLATTLATYISDHPAGHYTLRDRIRGLTRMTDAELEIVVPLVDHALELFERIDADNS